MFKKFQAERPVDDSRNNLVLPLALSGAAVTGLIKFAYHKLQLRHLKDDIDLYDRVGIVEAKKLEKYGDALLRRMAAASLANPDGIGAQTLIQATDPSERNNPKLILAHLIRRQVLEEVLFADRQREILPSAAFVQEVLADKSAAAQVLAEATEFNPHFVPESLGAYALDGVQNWTV